jgi:hypothetical protein
MINRKSLESNEAVNIKPIPIEILRKMVRKIKHNIVYNLIIMLDKVKDYDKNENFSDFIIDPELQKFFPKETLENTEEINKTAHISKNPNEELMKKGMKDLYSNRTHNPFTNKF